MNKKDIDSIAYLIGEAKKNNQPKPIVFLGAGASMSAGIPGSAQIIEDILKKYSNKPEIRKLDASSRDYYKLMACLNTDERHRLLRGYITDKGVKINVSHIYLAQMVNEGYIDYVLTVNFDDLFLRACALFNFIPPVYDISILKDFTTTTLTEGSVTYLHGQYHGFWLLNTGEELEKVKEYIPTVLDRICNKRTWIIVGYSGEDPIFDQIARLGHFTNELFWVGYNDIEPSENVKEKLLTKANSNASWTSGYDADSFFLKLHSELGMKTPDIFNKPFSFLKGLMGNIKDIDEGLIKGDHKQLFKNVKERYDVAIKQTDDAIKVYEKNDGEGGLTSKDINRDRLKQEIIEATVKGNYENAEELYKRAGNEDEELKELLSILFFDWGNELRRLANEQDNEAIHEAAIKNYRIAAELDPNYASIFNNWGSSLFILAKKRAETSLFYEAIDKYRHATELDPQYSLAFRNWGISLLEIAKKSEDKTLFEEAIDKLNKAIKIDSKNKSAFKSLAYAFNNLAKMVPPELSKNYLTSAIENAEKAIELGDSQYNLSCSYALLKEKNFALNLLENVFRTKGIAVNDVLNDDDWKDYLEDEDFKGLIEKYQEKT